MKKYGRLTVIEERGEKYLCKCNCGKIKEIRKYDILNGKTKSCGCLQRQKTSSANTKHGKRNERLYRIWCGMKQRCYNKNHVRFERYGARGITVCDEWKNDFKAFYNWSIAHGYSDNLTIDRIDNDGNYCPLNCRWVDYKTQYENSVHSDEFLSHINHGANTPDYCEIYNGKIDENTRVNLDKQYYINLAKKRLLDYGIEV